MNKLALLLPLVLMACKEEPKPVIVMMGDSHIEMGDWQSLTRKCAVVNLGHGGDTMAQVAAKIPEARAYSPRAVYVMAGINDLYANVPMEETAKNLKAIVTELGARPFPVMYVAGNRDMADKIDALNSGEIERWTNYMDLPDVFEAHRYLAPRYAMEDGLHLNDAGRKVWYKQMKKEFKEIGC